MLDKFLNDNSMAMRLVRTIVQGIIAVLIVAFGRKALVRADG